MKNRIYFALVVFLSACGAGGGAPILQDVDPVMELDCTKILTWNLTPRLNGEPFTSAEVARFTISRFNEDETTIVNVVVEEPGAVMFMFIGLPAGTMFFKINVTEKLKLSDGSFIDGATSVWSNVVSKTFPPECDE